MDILDGYKKNKIYNWLLKYKKDKYFFIILSNWMDVNKNIPVKLLSY